MFKIVFFARLSKTMARTLTTKNLLRWPSWFILCNAFARVCGRYTAWWNRGLEIKRCLSVLENSDKNHKISSGSNAGGSCLISPHESLLKATACIIPVGPRRLNPGSLSEDQWGPFGWAIISKPALKPLSVLTNVQLSRYYAKRGFCTRLSWSQ